MERRCLEGVEDRQTALEQNLSDGTTQHCEMATNVQPQNYSLFYPAGSFGFVANSVVIPVLFTKKMNNTFSRFLVCLAIFDNVYVTCSILECVRKYFWGTELHKVRAVRAAYDTIFRRLFVSKFPSNTVYGITREMNGQTKEN